MTTEIPEGALLIDAYQSGANLLVILHGRMVLDNCEPARARLHDLMHEHIDKYYVHIGDLEYVDSAGWGAMVGLKMAANRNRTKLSFLSPTPRIMEIFKISKLDSIFDIAESPEADVIRSGLEKPDYQLWRDSEDKSPGRFPTNAMATPHERQRPAEIDEPAAAERKRQIEACLRDAIEHLRNGDYQKVVDTYLKVLEYDPDDLSALNNLGVVYEKRPDWRDKAIEIWQRVHDVSAARDDAKHAERAKRHLDALAESQA